MERERNGSSGSGTKEEVKLPAGNKDDVLALKPSTDDVVQIDEEGDCKKVEMCEIKQKLSELMEGPRGLKEEDVRALFRNSKNELDRDAIMNYMLEDFKVLAATRSSEVMKTVVEELKDVANKYKEGDSEAK